MPHRRVEIALALDTPPEEAYIWIERTADFVDVFKIPPWNFYGHGAALTVAAHKHGRKVFADLKLHDIPNTVANSVGDLADRGVDYATVHLAGGPRMLADAQRAAGKNLTLLGVTLLTSLDADDVHRLFGGISKDQYVQNLVRAGNESGIRGFVCSPPDIASLKETLKRDGDRHPEAGSQSPRGFFVCPGIRLEGQDAGDQKRVATPLQAAALGANMLVLGRAILQHPKPEAALKSLRARLSRP